MAADLHPVVDVLRARRDERSTREARSDPHRVALVIEGGGMRGVVSAGMTAALERLGLADAFDLVVGSSAGALNGAGLLAGVAGQGPGVYAGPLASREFINPARLLIGRPAVDLRFLLTYAATNLGPDGAADPEAEARAIATLAPLVCVAVDVDTAEGATFTDLRTREQLWQALMATMRMPLFGGRPVEIDGRRFIDGALAEPVPLQTALDLGATHVLVLQTRPYGVPRSTGSRVAERLIERHLRGINPVLERRWRERAGEYELLVEDIARRSASPGDEPPHVLGLRPPAGTEVVGQLERRPPVLLAAAAAAEGLVEAVLGEGAAESSHALG
ncbi:MAG: patatin-like phospholipase family protein [Solirubrobacterales bacterium]|nr:patatin-like phospholipase family protein [Solirubrobacterales bacterium]